MVDVHVPRWLVQCLGSASFMDQRRMILLWTPAFPDEVCSWLDWTHFVCLASFWPVGKPGGYAYERGEGSLLREFGAENLWSLPTTSGKQADGAGIAMARRDVDAHLIHMDQVIQGVP